MVKKIILIRSNFIDRDPWLLKEIKTLKKNGYEITLIYWNRDCKDFKIPKKYFEAKGLNLKSYWGSRVIPLIPIWWLYVLICLIKYEWNIIHAINLDSAIPAILISKLRRKPMIYEIFDIYTDIIILPKFISKIGIKIEKLIMRLSNAVIIANKSQEKALNGIPNQNVVEIYKTPTDYDSYYVKNDIFTIFYAGVLYKCRIMNLDNVVQAIRDLDGIQLIIAGYGDMVPDIKKWCNEMDGKINFLGKINYEEVLKNTIESDLLFALYDPNIPGVKNASCNKLFEAIMASKPIMVSKDTAMAEMVKEENCGIVIDPSNVDEIRNAISKLKENPQLCLELGKNGRKAYESKYNHEIMEKKLLNIYNELI